MISGVAMEHIEDRSAPPEGREWEQLSAAEQREALNDGIAHCERYLKAAIENGDTNAARVQLKSYAEAWRALVEWQDVQ